MADEKREGRDGEERGRRAKAGRGERGTTSEVRAVLDRVEDGDVAVLVLEDESNTQLDLPLSSLPEGATDGDHFRLTFDDGGGDAARRKLLGIAPAPQSRAAAEDRVRALQERLAQKSGTAGKKDFKL